MTFRNTFSLHSVHFWTVFSGLCLSVSTTMATGAPDAPAPPPAPESWPNNLEGIIALAIVTLAVLIAVLINSAPARLRAAGTALAGLSCVGMLAWFNYVLGSGIMENPKPFQTPMDAYKPVLLWGQMAVVFVVALWLFKTAFLQYQQGERLTLSRANSEYQYGSTSRLLHWTTAILFIFLIPTGIFSSMIPQDAWFRKQYAVVHKSIGLILIALFIIRMIWNNRSQRPALDAALKPGERKAAQFAHKALYVLLLAVPVTGYVMTSMHGYASYFFVFRIEPLLEPSKAYIYWGLFHKYIFQYVVYLVLGAHILGVLKHHFIDNHKDSIKRMLS